MKRKCQAFSKESSLGDGEKEIQSGALTPKRPKAITTCGWILFF